MKTIVLDQGMACRHHFTLHCAQQGKLRAGEAFYGFKYSDHALLVEPVNGNPTVFVAPNTLHVFEATPGSGTDKLRQRIVAQLFFERVEDAMAGATR
ncbi:MAG: hypothetical protein EPN64_13110 [Burkholderiaceae bacterium]|nr:MAG: hypothetical protein EPN64_13110 [Burkholderiaceae bacterium]